MRVLVALSLLISLQAAATPLAFTHQARLLDAAGQPLDGTFAITFSLYADASGGSPLWTETANAQIEDGFLSHVLGSGTSLDLAHFNGETRYLALSIDAAPELSPRVPLTSVPYALRASRAEEAANVRGGVVDASEIRVNGQVVIDGSGAISGVVSFLDLADLPDDLLDGDDDLLAALSCADGQIARFQGGSWSCGDAAAHEHAAADLSSGTLDIARLPVGTTSETVAAGDHVHSFSQITGELGLDRTTGDLDISRTTGSIPFNRLPVGTTSNTVKAGDAPDADTLGALSCTSGQTIRRQGSSWVCVDAGVFAGSVKPGDDTATCNTAKAGAIRWHSDALEVCDGAQWVGVVVSGLGSSQTRPGLTCNDIARRDPAAQTGLYWVDPNGGSTGDAKQAWCDMDIDGGGWTLVYSHNYTKGNRSQLQGNVTALATVAVTPEGPSPANNYRIPLAEWPSHGTGQELLYRASDKRSGDAGAPADLWIKQTATFINPSDGHRLTHTSASTLTKSHSCLQAEALRVHTKGPYQGTSGGDYGGWQSPHCSGDGAPWSTISCWCISMGTSSGVITPTGCGSGPVNGHLFYHNGDSTQRCGSNSAGMANSQYASVALYVR